MFFFLCFGWFLALFWFWHGAIVLHFLHLMQISKLTTKLPPLNHYPKLSIIVPARDEAAKIYAGLSSLLQLDYPHFEVIAVNDRSVDETGAIMEALQRESSCLKVLHINELPERWLGKNHAMHLAAQQATGDYLLFTDADVVFAPDTLKQAMQVVQAQQWDHLALLPRLLPGGYAENCVLQFMGLVFIMSLYPFLIAKPSSQRFAGVGAFNLIGRACYQQIGGFAALPLEMIDDMGLGRAVKQQGWRSQLLFAESLLQVRWQQKVTGLVCGIEKNSFAALSYSPLNLIVLTLAFILFIFAPYLAIFIFPSTIALGYALALAVLHGILVYTGTRAKVGWQISFGLLFGAGVTLWAIWRSAFLTLKQGGVYWRDTFYPLALLKK